MDKQDMMDMKENVLQNLRSVTQSSKGGVPVDLLQKDYKSLLGTEIPFRDLGYNSLEAFLRDIPDVISVKKNHEGMLMAVGVADASTAHIASLVSRQKDSKTSSKTRRPHYNTRRSFPVRSLPRARSRPSSQDVRSSKAWDTKSNTSQHSKSYAPPVRAEQVSTRRKEIAPRFLRQLEQKLIENSTNSANGPSALLRTPALLPTPSQTVISSNDTAERSSYYRVERPSYHTTERSSSYTAEGPSHHTLERSSHHTLEKSFHHTIERPSHHTVERLSRPISSTSIKKTDERQMLLNSLETAASAKEYVRIYAQIHNIKHEYQTVRMGQKSKGFISNLKLGEKKYQSYPHVARTVEEAEEVAAKSAVEDIKLNIEQLAAFPVTPVGSAAEIQILLNRIEEIVCEKPSGMFTNGISREYENKFNEVLPDGWLELLKQSTRVDIDDINIGYGRVPDGVKYIVRPAKELSSGSATPSSTSSKSEFRSEVLDLPTLKNSLYNVSHSKFPLCIKLPDGNEWDLFITTISHPMAARFVDHSVAFSDLSEEMKAFYQSRNCTAFNVVVNELYAACLDECPDRVIVVDTSENDSTLCYLVDQGDYLYVPKANLQELDDRFRKLPYQAILMNLDAVEDYEDFIKYEHINILCARTLIAEVKRSFEATDCFPDNKGIHPIIYSVVLYDTSGDDDINLNDVIKKSVLDSLTCRLPKHGVSSCAYLTHIKSSGEIYLRFLHPEESWLEKLLEKYTLQFEESYPEPVESLVNRICVAKYSDGHWCRVVLDNVYETSNPEMVKVFYVDYGHDGIVNRRDIRKLEPISEFLAFLPHQCVECELFDAVPNGAKWTEAASSKLMEMAPFNEEIMMRVMHDGSEGNLAKVNLYKRNEAGDIITINQTLANRSELFHETSVSLAKNLSPETHLFLKLRNNFKQNKSSLSSFMPDVVVPAEERAKKGVTTPVTPNTRS
ncbi:tudor domain-containing protein 7-like isoform X2 [Stegodyphus dumicola]|uniref:tudor domain-containing protein 7-like isoform X2 n=1 Tax=Stegodyphus dumicola TaxID=202533 RepID=UPI0015A82F00|nr:tudor domain-containing protein 7-like isoform X2 [Stegodyphus dumicola]